MQRLRQFDADGDAVLGQAHGGFDQLPPRQTAVAGMGECQPGHSAGHAGRLMAIADAGLIHLALCIQVEIPAYGGRRGFSKIERLTTFLRGVVNQHKAAATQIAGLRQRDR